VAAGPHAHFRLVAGNYLIYKLIIQVGEESRRRRRRRRISRSKLELRSRRTLQAPPGSA
jgi:hypothetical protein